MLRQSTYVCVYILYIRMSQIVYNKNYPTTVSQQFKNDYVVDRDIIKKIYDRPAALPVQYKRRQGKPPNSAVVFSV